MFIAYLNDAWSRAVEGANTLRDQLLQDQIASLALVKQGSVASVGKNSASQSYKPYGPATLTQVQAVETIGSLLGLYDQLQSKLTEEFEASADFNYAVPAGFDYDEPIRRLLTNVFNALSSGTAQMLPDLSELRLPPSLILGVSPTTW